FENLKTLCGKIAVHKVNACKPPPGSHETLHESHGYWIASYAKDNWNIRRYRLGGGNGRSAERVYHIYFFLFKIFRRLLRPLWISLLVADHQGKLFSLFEPHLLYPDPKTVNGLIPWAAREQNADALNFLLLSLSGGPRR